jgi:putative RecB family exonuclease
VPQETSIQKPLTDLAAWGGRNNAKLVLSPAAVKKVTRSTLSPSTAEAMSGCSARWVIERVIPRTVDPFGAAELGTAAHFVFETVFGLPADERTTQTAMAIISTLQHAGGEIAIPSDPNDIDRWHSRVAKLVTGLWTIENPRELEIVGLEIQMKNVKLGDVPFGGYIDRLAVKNGLLTTGDYKTGKIISKHFGDKHGDQLRMYVMALANSEGFDKPEAAEVLYTQYEECHEVDLGAPAMDATLEKFERAWVTLNKQVTSTEFATKTSALCGWCPAVSVCPAAEAKGLVAKVAFAVEGEMLGISETSNVTAVGTGTTTTTGEAGQLSERRGTDSAETINQKEAINMYEPKPWEETNEDGTLNLNSYAATAAFGIVEIAVEQLHANEQKITGANVRAFSQTLEIILDSVFRELGDGEPSFAAGRHTRLRGALRTSLETIPAPFGSDAEAWDQWVHQSTVRTKAIAKTAVALWEGEDRSERPWDAFAAKGDVDEFADA